MTQRPRIPPRKYWSPACQRYVSRETGPLIWPIRLAHQIPNFLACVGGVGLLCGAIIVARELI